ncbi:SUKH-4 family immunity protein [Streptomyces sp. TRM68416]|uniref:SUKH-4 family immunity protein n=1 Tax=Streptomyces sp. TRM68416 TaxID=2758412 RepID=UPI002948C45A|nr:SUKH-4 family immunity protein [Streptomyces sp. TRM68416]
MSTTATASGLVLDLHARLLDQEFGRGRMMRFEDVDFPAALTHEPTRRFLRETGLPEDGVLFHPDADVPLPTLAELCAEEGMPEVPARSGRLIRLGRLTGGTSLLLDGGTGAVLDWRGPGTTPHPLPHVDVSTVVFTLWLIRHARTSGRSPCTDGEHHRPPGAARRADGRRRPALAVDHRERRRADERRPCGLRPALHRLGG